MSKRGLNVGSGQRRFTSTPEVKWVNIDKVSRPGMEPDLVYDGAHLPCDNESVDIYVLHHVLEHLWPGHAAELIKEAHRVLKPGGQLLVFVPDMRALANMWLNGKFDTQLYFTNVYGAYMGNEEDFHRWGYTEGTLRAFIAENGPWSRLHTFEWEPIPGGDFARSWWILAQEAIK